MDRFFSAVDRLNDRCGWLVGMQILFIVAVIVYESVLRGLFGQFNPSRGDLVFNKNGELLGIMANNTYCLKLRDFNAVATMQFGQDVRSQHTGNTLARLYAFIVQKPSKLQ